MVVPDTGTALYFDVEVPIIVGHRGLVQDLQFSPFHDNVLATCSNDCTTKVWIIPQQGLDSVMGEGEEHANLLGHDKKVLLLKWNPVSGFNIATASMDQTIKIWDVK